MSPKVMEVEGLDELIDRLQRTPQVYKQAEQKTMVASLTILWENVPPYPPAPATSRYVRTGTLGRSLGSSMGGGATGQPQIFGIKMYSKGAVGSFGTRLKYAQYVIGSRHTQQIYPFSAYWWTIDTIIGKAYGKILRAWKIMAEELAKFLEGRGL